MHFLSSHHWQPLVLAVQLAQSENRKQRSSTNGAGPRLPLAMLGSQGRQWSLLHVQRTPGPALTHPSSTKKAWQLGGRSGFGRTLHSSQAEENTRRGGEGVREEPARKSAEKHLAPLLRDVSLCVLPPKTSSVPLMSTAECKYRGKPLSLRMNLEKHTRGKRFKGRSPGVDVVAVEVVDEAVFVGGQRLVAPVDVHAAAGAVVRAAVAVTALGNGARGLRHQPRVGL
ncbi:hypothetical protein EYF80_044534 [Liparis tanakae]|uniref:Uncharacterized protein n=1 Tax=Liparis tanakae TaxID=230148 RepID=A0A4Z2FY64_9TELE|nr:hypothetical protein EYF80_044534 [Liparis tanakae]